MHILNLDKNFTTNYSGGSYGFIEYEKLTFAAGESHIKLKKSNDVVTNVLICHRINSSQRLMELLLAADAIRRTYDCKVSAYIPYIPYGRQDRPMIEGEPFSLAVFAEIIKVGKFDKIYTNDPHSDVTPALIPNLVVRPSNYLVMTSRRIKSTYGDFVLLAPDGGALKKIYKNAERIGCSV